MVAVAVFLLFAAVPVSGSSTPTATAPSDAAYTTWLDDRSRRACEADLSFDACLALAELRGDDVLVPMCTKGIEHACAVLAARLPDEPPPQRRLVVDVLRSRCGAECIFQVLHWPDDALASDELAPLRDDAIRFCGIDTSEHCLSTSWTGSFRERLSEAVFTELMRRCETAPDVVGQAKRADIRRAAEETTDLVERERLLAIEGFIDGSEGCMLLTDYADRNKDSTLQWKKGPQAQVTFAAIAGHTERRCRQTPGLRACKQWLASLSGASARQARAEVCKAKGIFCDNSATKSTAPPTPEQAAWTTLLDVAGVVAVEDEQIYDVDVSKNARVEPALAALCAAGHVPACTALTAWQAPSPPLPSLSPPPDAIWDGAHCFVDRLSAVDADDFGNNTRDGDFVEVVRLGSDGKLSRTLLLVRAAQRPAVQWCFYGRIGSIQRLRLLAPAALNAVATSTPPPPPPALSSTCSDTTRADEACRSGDAQACADLLDSDHRFALDPRARFEDLVATAALEKDCRSGDLEACQGLRRGCEPAFAVNVLAVACERHRQVCEALFDDVEVLPRPLQTRVLSSRKACDQRCRSTLVQISPAVVLPDVLHTIVEQDCRRFPRNEGCLELSQHWDPRTRGAALLSAILDGARKACTDTRNDAAHFSCALVDDVFRRDPLSLSAAERARTVSHLQQRCAASRAGKVPRVRAFDAACELLSLP
jgi:hypothetical protein